MYYRIAIRREGDHQGQSHLWKWYSTAYGGAFFTGSCLSSRPLAAKLADTSGLAGVLDQLPPDP